MNKFLKLIICCFSAFLISTMTAFAYSNTPKTASDEIINVIKLLEIANGDENGNMNFDKEVTRAEFVKMVINASSSKETAANIKLNVSLFPDVKNSYWGAGYIYVAINNNLVNGYIDGTFKPGNSVTLEEAATIVLRLLGYSSDDLIGSYPTAQLQKYSDLKLNENISAKRGDKLTREECMILLYNTLSTKNKQGNVYCTTIGCEINSESKLDYSSLLEDKLEGPVIIDELKSNFENISFKEDINTKYILNNALSAKTELQPNDVIYYSDIINSVFAYRKTATGIVENANSSSVTLSGRNYTLATASAKDKLSLGGEFNEEKSFVTLLLGINDAVVDVVRGSVDKITENNDNSSHLSMIDATISKGIYLKDANEAQNWKNKVPLDVDNATVYFNGAITTSASLQAHDVIYYTKPFNTVWIYRKTVSGTLEQITPSTSPESVTVSGKTYSIEGSTTAYDLSVFGKYEVGDSVTLILGLNDTCVAVTDTSDTSGIIYGIITSKGEKNYTDKNGDEYTADFITVTDTAANVYTYEYNNNNFEVGDIVKVAVAGNVRISRVSTEIGRGNAASIISAIKNGNFSQDCEIIDVKGSQVIKVKPERIKGLEIDYGEFIYSTVVLYYSFDENRNLSKLILSDFTGDIDEYGVITSVSDGKIKYKTDNNVKTLSTDAGGVLTGPAKLRVSSGNVVDAVSLNGYIENIQAITNLAVYDENDNEYLLSDNIKVFIKNINSYDYSSISEIVSGNYTYKAYYDKLPEYGGRIRVIIATRKA